MICNEYIRVNVIEKKEKFQVEIEKLIGQIHTINFTLICYILHYLKYIHTYIHI